MPTVLFPDDNSIAAALDLAQSQDDARVVGTVLREYELRLREQAGIGPQDWLELRCRSVELMDELGRAMPPELSRAGAEGVSFWATRGEYFRSWALAPLLANALIARAAAQEHSPEHVMVLENLTRPAWWTFRQQVYEPVRAGLLGSGLEPEMDPPAWVRWLRRSVLALTAHADGLLRLFGGTRALKRRRWMSGLADPSKADVLFLPIGGTNVPIVDRLAPELEAAHGLSSAALMLNLDDLGMERQARSGTPYAYIDQFHEGLAGALRASARVALGWPWWYLHVLRHANRTEFGRLWPAVTALLMVTLGRDSQQMLADINAAQRVLDRYEPKVIVSLHLSWYRLAPIVLAARARGIPVVYLQHGVFLAKDDCTLPLPYDEMLVFGEGAAEALADRVGEARVSVVGHCLYDEIGAGQEGNEARGDSRQVLLATQPYVEERDGAAREDWWVRGVAEACKALDLALVVKLHPREAFAEGYYRLERELPETVRVVAHGERNLGELIRQSCCLATVDSTVVLEAGLLGVPSLVVNLHGRRDRFPFVADKGAAGAYRYEDILPTLRRIVETGGEELAGSREAFLRRHLGTTDGQSTRLVAAVVARHARGKGAPPA